MASDEGICIVSHQSWQNESLLEGQVKHYVSLTSTSQKKPLVPPRRINVTISVLLYIHTYYPMILETIVLQNERVFHQFFSVSINSTMQLGGLYNCCKGHLCRVSAFNWEAMWSSPKWNARSVWGLIGLWSAARRPLSVQLLWRPSLYWLQWVTIYGQWNKLLKDVLPWKVCRNRCKDADGLISLINIKQGHQRSHNDWIAWMTKENLGQCLVWSDSGSAGRFPSSDRQRFKGKWNEMRPQWIAGAIAYPSCSASVNAESNSSAS